MNTLQQWAEFYKGLRIWIYPYHDSFEQFEWRHWRNMDRLDYEKEFKTYDWNAANGINFIAGKKGIMGIRFPKDEDVRYAMNSLLKVLSILGLPQDYDWVIESETAFSIFIDVCNMPIGRIQKKHKDFELIYEEAFILPPGINHYECFFKNGFPKMYPSQIPWNILTEKFLEIEKQSLIFRGYTKEQEKLATKAKIVAGGALAIVIAIITGVLAILNSTSFDTWVFMFLGTLGAAIGLIYIMSH